ncbi:MAG: ABC transporter permease [Thermoguttaceae bacterium]|nr:ABC transporter permease [Thermoguttaceae bacterium]
MKRLERLFAIVWKEWLQVFRDPSALLVAFVLPAVMLFLFGYGLSLDATDVRIGAALEDSSPLARSFYNSLDASKYFSANYYSSRSEAELALRNGEIRAVVVVPNDFSQKVGRGETGTIQILTDGGETNLSLIAENYLTAAFAKWRRAQLYETGSATKSSGVVLETKTLYNTAQISRNSLTPGSMGMILAMIGTLLTCMVVAREWERGTMEATLATSVGRFELFFGKLIPYFLLGLVAALYSALMTRYLFHVPFRGSLLAFIYASSAFLLVATSQGLLISSICRDQNLASQIALLSSFLPNYILSGVIFEIDAMPRILQIITYIFPARYYVVCLQTIFMAGDIWPLLNRQIGCIAIIGAIFFVAAIAKTPRRL